MEDFGLDVARATLLEELGKYPEAADVLVEEGNTVEALRVLALGRGDARCTRQAAKVTLAGLWSILPLGVVPTETLIASHSTLGLLLAHAKTMLSEDLRPQLDESTRDEVCCHCSSCHAMMQWIYRLKCSMLLLCETTRHWTDFTRGSCPERTLPLRCYV